MSKEEGGERVIYTVSFFLSANPVPDSARVSVICCSLSSICASTRSIMSLNSSNEKEADGELLNFAERTDRGERLERERDLKRRERGRK